MQVIRVVVTASFLGLFGFAGLFANYGAPPSESSNLEKRENQLNMPNSVSTLLARKVVDERRVYHAVRGSRAATQTLKASEISAMHLGTQGDE